MKWLFWVGVAAWSLLWLGLAVTSIISEGELLAATMPIIYGTIGLTLGLTIAWVVRHPR